MDRTGPIAYGASLSLGTPVPAWGAGGVLSFSLNRRREPTPLCPSRRGGLLSPAVPGLAKIPEGDGLLGQSEQGDGEGIAPDWTTALRTLAGGRRAGEG